MSIQTFLGSINFGDQTLENYKKAIWTPVGSGCTLIVNSAVYIRIGDIVIAQFDVTWPTTANGDVAFIGGLPITPATGLFGVIFGYSNETLTVTIYGDASGLTLRSVTNTALTNAQLSEKRVAGMAVYFL